MHMRFHLPVEFYQLVKRKPKELSAAAGGRLQTMTAWTAMREASYSADQASRKLGVARATLYRWQKRLIERNLRGLLEEDSRRPKRLRTYVEEFYQCTQTIGKYPIRIRSCKSGNGSTTRSCHITHWTT